MIIFFIAFIAVVAAVTVFSVNIIIAVVTLELFVLDFIVEILFIMRIDLAGLGEYTRIVDIDFWLNFMLDIDVGNYECKYTRNDILKNIVDQDN